jgi:Skp family chaperone for outer membrane proteins
MSTGLIIAIVVIALILVALFAFVLPRMRRTAEVRARQRELLERRERVAGENRAEASTLAREAEAAERRSRMARAEADKQRAEAELRQQRAELHERGMADHELVEDHEREHFAPALGEDAVATDRPVETDTEPGRFARDPERTDGPAEPRRTI